MPLPFFRFQGARLAVAMFLVGALAACGPEVDLSSEQGTTGLSTTDAPADGSGETSGGTHDVDSSSDDDTAESGSSSTGSAGKQSCVELAQMQWTDFGKLGAQTCGDMTLAGRSADRSALLVLSVPPILGSPWDADWTAHARYTLPDRGVVAQVARYAAPLPSNAVICEDGGVLPDGAIEVYDIEADLDFYLLNRDEVGCLFTCDTVYAQILNATIDCGEEKIPLGAPGTSEAGTILLYGFAELP